MPVQEPEGFSESGSAAVPDQWWTVFGDDRLNAFVDSALTNNFDLNTAWERLQASRAVVDRESSFLLPGVDASMQMAESFPQPDFVGGENVRIGLTAQYEIDLWGRINSRVEAERFRAEAARTDYQTSAISLSSEIVLTWYRLAEARSQLALADRQIETNQQILDLLEARFGSGQIRSADILRQRQLLEATRNQRIGLESDVEVIAHQLAVLMGRAPQDTEDLLPGVLPDLPPLPETGLPIELIRRRPDVQRAFLLLQAADRDLASAISSQYPRLTISANASLRSNNFDNLFRDFAYSFAGSLFAPIFLGGQLSAEVDRNEAVRQQRLYEYGQAILTAFREVEDALIREQKQRESIESIERQLGFADQTYQQLRVEYLNGISNYLDVLTALDQQQQLGRTLLSARLGLLEFRISLYRSLAGGFDTGRETQQNQ